MKIKIGEQNIDLLDEYSYTNNSELSADQITTILGDPQAQSKFDIRIKNAQKFSYAFKSEDVKDAVLESVKDKFDMTSKNYINFKHLASFILSGIAYGYSLTEIVWKGEQGKQYIDYFKPISQDLYEFTSTKQIKIHLSNSILDLAYKFLLFQNTPTTKNPSGDPIFGTEIYNLVLFKKRAVILLDQLLDKFGVPSVVALYKLQEQDEIKKTSIRNAISTALESLRSGAGAALENIDQILTLSATGTAMDFEKAGTIADEAIAKVILGTAVSIDSQSKGSYSNNKTAENITEIYALDDSQVLQMYINQIIRMIVDVEFGTDYKAPKFEYDYREFTKPTVGELLQARVNGEQISKKAFYEVFPEPEDEADILPPLEVKVQQGFSKEVPQQRLSIPR